MNSRSWPRIYEKRHRSGIVGYVVDAGKFGGSSRYRKGFRTLPDAKAFAKALRIQRSRFGSEIESLDLNEMMTLCQAKRLLLPFEISILDAVNYFVAHYPKSQKSPTLDSIANELIENSIRLGSRDDTIRDIKQRLAPFLNDFGDRKPVEIHFDEIRELRWTPMFV